MATQSPIRPIGPLLAVTILTSICATVPSKSGSSEQSEELIVAGANLTGIRARNGMTLSAESVEEARWARPQREYAVDATGQVAPLVAPEGAADAGFPMAFGDDSESKSGTYLFNGDFRNDRGLVEGECGPSPATPAEITRLVVAAAQRHEVDAGFAIAIVTVESRLDRLRNSSKGARGPMQLMPGTADRFGVTDICDLEQNIDGGVRYLRELTERFRNPLLVAAAYNAGEENVRKHGGIPPFKETVGYVADVLNVQMGLKGSGPIARNDSGSTDQPPSASSVSGVITSRERRQWVGGVMHF